MHEIIEEEDEDKNNNTNLMKSKKSNKEDKNVNIKVVKDDKIEDKEIKKGFQKINRFNQMYKSLALSKEKNRNRITISSNENYIYDSNVNELKSNKNNSIFTPNDKNISKTDNKCKNSLPLLNNPSNISSKNRISNNYNNDPPSTSAYTNSTKNNNIRNDHNLTEQVSKFRIGLFSANSSSNNNAIIPILPIKRPVSNFNFGGNQLWETDDGNKDIKKAQNFETILNKEINLNKKPIIQNYNKNKFLKNNKLKNIFKSSDYKYRDRFILSKGHISPLYYSILAQKGFFDKSELLTFRKLGSRLQGHPSKYCPGVDVSTGSLGQGLAVASGIAMGLKLDKSDGNVFVMMGDGEMQEGSVWESLMGAAQRGLDNLVIIIVIYIKSLFSFIPFFPQFSFFINIKITIFKKNHTPRLTTLCY
mgnify:CR=1 FL=1